MKNINVSSNSLKLKLNNFLFGRILLI